MKKQKSFSEELLELDMSTAELVAEISSASPERSNWTELRVWYMPGRTESPYIGEQVGGTRVHGQERRVRRAANTTMQRLLKWFPENTLADDLERDCLQWCEVRGAGVLKSKRGYQGPAVLFDVLAWLYPDIEPGERPKAIERDFSVPARTVRHSLGTEGGGEALNGWPRAFIAAMRHFNREAFDASRG